MPYRGDDDPFPADAIEDEIGASADHELADSGVGTPSAEVGMIPQGLHHGDDSRGQALGGLRLIFCDVIADFPQPRSRQGRPDNL
jgi:hypothetical protein